MLAVSDEEPRDCRTCGHLGVPGNGCATATPFILPCSNYWEPVEGESYTQYRRRIGELPPLEAYHRGGKMGGA